MRIPRALAWVLLGMGVFTAGLLRQFHDLTPRAPFLAPAVGSLLFACVLFLFLVAARERQVGASPGPGIRLGSLTPLLLMLLFEKWVSSSFYQPVFAWLAPADLPAAEADAWFRALCGAGLLAIVAVLWRFSAPAASWVGARLAAGRVPGGVASSLVAIGGTYAVLAAISLAAGSGVRWAPPSVEGPVGVVVFGQAGLALAEEIYFRGLLLGEMLRLAPRLGLSRAAVARWLVLVSTSGMFAMEHLGGAASWGEGVRQFVFTLALGLLFGMLVLVTANLWYAAVLHAWINWLLLGATPRLAFGAPDAALAPGVYIFLALIGAFVVAFLTSRRGDGRRPG